MNSIAAHLLIDDDEAIETPSKKPRLNFTEAESEMSNVHSNVDGLNQYIGSVVDAASRFRKSAPICRQFWKAGDYVDELERGQVHATAARKNGMNYLSVHPKFLHSNATSHKWVFGAIAELVDNAVDEIPNGATFVGINKISNPRDGSPALLIQDNGGGMDPEAMRHCLSFGFNKKAKTVIGQYGNGFKTSTMRLGADVIVFSCSKKMRTQSIGLLSYTFLKSMGLNKIIVPMVHYEFNVSTESFSPIIPNGMDHFQSNLSLLLDWCPYSTEEELLKQFEDIGEQGTKVITYNLWYNDDGDMELDFVSDAEDIRISGSSSLSQSGNSFTDRNELHIANIYHYSLRAYLSILYLRLEQNFHIILCGRVVQHHNMADDLKFHEYILYKQQAGEKHKVITTIGFLKEAPDIIVHGFSIYRRRRLILPYWRVLKNVANSIGRGVVGVLEANCIQPTHNKQDFEKTSLFQKLEVRLKQMALEYWDTHCEFIGYKANLKAKCPSPVAPSAHEMHPMAHVSSKRRTSVGFESSGTGGNERRQQNVPPVNQECAAEIHSAREEQPTFRSKVQSECAKLASLLQQNKKLREQILKLEKSVEGFFFKAGKLRSELTEVQSEYKRLLVESKTTEVQSMKMCWKSPVNDT